MDWIGLTGKKWMKREGSEINPIQTGGGGGGRLTPPKT